MIAAVTPANILTLPHGLHPGIDASVYHQRHLGLASNSALGLVLRSLAHYKAWVDRGDDDDEGEEPSAALAFGAAFHCAVLEPSVFARTYVERPDLGDGRTKEGKALREAWRKQHAGKTEISLQDLRTISGMRTALHQHPLASRILRDGQSELTLRWRDSETGVECKSRADYYVPTMRLVADIKTTQDARREAFRKSIATYRYHLQDALYRSGFAAVGAPVDHFVFIAIEKVPPYAIGVYSLGSDGVGEGYSLARRALDKLATALKTDDWPAYDVGIQQLDLPPWAA